MNDIRKAKLMAQIKELIPDMLKEAEEGMYCSEAILGKRRMADNTEITLKLVAIRECPPGVTKNPDVDPKKRRSR